MKLTNLYLSKVKKVGRKNILIIIVSVVLAILLLIGGIFIFSKSDTQSEPSVAVTKEEMNEYRAMIGNNMDVKKAIFIMFETEEECYKFIKEHGADEQPEKSGEGIVPMMEEGYYNIIGKEEIEEVFDTLKDGEYLKRPVKYSNMFCYLKRIEKISPIEDDEMLKEIIKQDKINTMRVGADDEK